jgi:hypothetical protein
MYNDDGGQINNGDMFIREFINKSLTKKRKKADTSNMEILPNIRALAAGRYKPNTGMEETGRAIDDTLNAATGIMPRGGGQTERQLTEAAVLPTQKRSQPTPEAPVAEGAEVDISQDPMEREVAKARFKRAQSIGKYGRHIGMGIDMLGNAAQRYFAKGKKKKVRDASGNIMKDALGNTIRKRTHKGNPMLGGALAGLTSMLGNVAFDMYRSGSMDRAERDVRKKKVR